MSFLERQFPTDISQGSRGGPRWRTVVTQSISGQEVRLQKWSNVKASYDVSYGIKTVEDLRTVVDFFNEMRGQAYGFRFKDWLDYTATAESLVPDGSPTVQLIKTYGTGLNNYVRTIKKPVAGITLQRNSSPYAPSPTFSLDTTTGIVTLQPILSASISNVTVGATTTITTSASHGFSSGNEIYLSGIGGVTSLNGNVYTITVTGGTTFTVAADTTSETYTSGGTAAYYVQSTDSLTWTGEFDVPVRFGQDSLDVSLDRPDYGGTSIMLEEVRL